MITTYEFKLADGSTKTATTLPEAAEIHREHPGSDISPRVHYQPCPNHVVYEAGNCPVCLPASFSRPTP